MHVEGKKTLEEANALKDVFEKNIENRKKDREAGYLVIIGLRITDTETGKVIYENMI